MRLHHKINHPTANQLPFKLTRKLGDDVGIITPTKKRKINSIHLDVAFNLQHSQTIAHQQATINTQQLIHHQQDFTITPSHKIIACQKLTTLGFIPLANAKQTTVGLNNLLSYDSQHPIQGFHLLHHHTQPKLSSTVYYQQCTTILGANVQALTVCKSNPIINSIAYQQDLAFSQQGKLISHCHSSKTQKAVPVPCRYYPVDNDDNTAIENKACRIRPPSSRLPIRLQRKTGQFTSSALPLNLQCWHDDEPTIIPNFRSYIVHNTITATVAGIAVEPLSFNIKTDINSYCWQGSIELTAKDYQNIKHKLDAEHEALINVNINGFLFTIIAEEQSRTRQFINHSYQLSGRSITAQLGADYAQNQSGLLDQANYASQIVHQQLAGLPFSCDFSVSDWLIPANAYAVTNKTPIAVLNDLAQACGGFLSSDESQNKLYIKPKWKSPAWEMATAKPDVVIALDVIKQINEQKRINPRYNTVTLIGTEGGIVYRQRENRQLDAPSQQNTLYTDQNCIVPAGQAILSDSGTHMDYVITLRWASKYNLALAKLSDIWQINDSDGAWKGIVTGVSVDIRLENAVPTVWQVVNIDRYLDV